MLLKINFGCGTSKLPGFVNCDADEALNPDKVVDLTKFPYEFENASASQIIMTHTIEHIQSRFHEAVLLEFNRILIPGGELIIAYPEFKSVAKNYIDNYQGKRDFWAATIYGRQLTPWDGHVALMDSIYFVDLMRICGFENIVCNPEPGQIFNTVVRAKNGVRCPSYEEALFKEIFT